MSFIDPPGAPDASIGTTIAAKDLKNKVVLLRPKSRGEWPPKDGREGNAFISCDVWELDRQGIVQEGETRISWWRAVIQLEQNMGKIMLAMPVEQADNSVILVKTEKENWKELAAKLVIDIEAATPLGEEPPEAGSEPF